MKYLDKFIYVWLLKVATSLLVILLLNQILLNETHLMRISFISLTSVVYSIIALEFLALAISIYNYFCKYTIFFNIGYYFINTQLFSIVHSLYSSESRGYKFFTKKIIAYNNRVQSHRIKKYSSDEILILIPHCLQYSDCKFKITYDINNCKQCGRCVIGDIKALGKKYNIMVKVATGGTLARKIVKDRKPKVILAVACYRDLMEGMKDIYMIPVYGILNKRPNGPCFNTTVDVDKIEESIVRILRSVSRETEI